MKNYQESPWDLQDITKRNDIHIMGILGEEKEKGTENIFKAVMDENFLNLEREMNIQIHEVQSIPIG